MNQDREGLRHPRVEDVLTLHDRLVDPRTALDVVRLDREELLQRIRDAVRLERPHLHFAHALAAELGLAAQRLLRDERVGTHRTRVDLVRHQVVELQHVDDADDDLLREGLARHAIVEDRLALGADPALLALGLLLHRAGFLEELVDLAFLHAVEDRRRRMEAEVTAREAEVGLEELAEVHSRRHAQRVQHDVDRTSIRQERHVAARQNARDDALVTVTAGHLVTDGEVLLVDEEDAHLLDDLAIAEVAEETAVAAFRGILDRGELHLERIHDARDLVARRTLVHLPVRMRLGEDRELALLDLLVRRDNHVPRIAVGDVRRQLLVHQRRRELGHEVLLELGELVLALLLGVLRSLLGLLLVHLLDLLGALHLHAHHDARRSRRNRERGVADVRRLLAEDGPQEALLRRKLGLALRRHLADQDVAGLHFGADADDAVRTEVLERVLGDVRNVARDLFRPELRVAGRALEGDDVKRRERVLADELLVHQNRVLEVVAAPGHERNQEVLAERELALVRRRTVGEAVADLDLLPLLDDRLLVEARARVAAAELLEVVAPHAVLRIVLELRLAGRQLPVLRDHDELGRDVRDRARLKAGDDDLRVLRRDPLEARPDERTLRRHQRHALTHHVRAHERAVRVIVLEERNQARRDRNDLHRGDVHVLDLARRLVAELGAETAGDALFGERAVRLQRRIGLRDHELLFLVRRQILDLVRHLAADDLAVRRLDEAEAVDLRVDAEGRNQADVRTFRRLDRANAAVVRRMHVADLEARAFAGEAARTESGETALVGESAERVRLVHELRELAAREEVLHHRAERLRVDETARRERTLVRIVHRHALADQALRAGEAHAALVLQKLARRADATVAEVVDVVHLILADVDLQEQADRLDDVDARLVERAEVLVDLAREAEALVDLVTADIAEIVVRQLEEHAVQHLLGVRRGRRISRTHALVDFLERVLLVADARLRVFAEGLDERAVVDGDVHHLNLADAGRGDLLHHRRGDRIIATRDHSLRVGVDQVVLHDQHAQVLVGVLLAGRKLLEVVEELHQLLVGAVAERTEKRRRIEFPTTAALIHEAPHDVVRVEHHLDPVAAVRDDAHGQERLAVGVHLLLGRDARRTVQLGDDHALRAVDDERAVRGHDRHVAEEDLLLAHVLAVLQTERGLERTHIALAVRQRLEIALLLGIQPIADEVEFVATVVAGDREDLLEDRLQTLVLTLLGSDVALQEVLIGLHLDVNQVRHRRRHALELAEYFAFCAHELTFFCCSKLTKIPKITIASPIQRLKCGKRPLC